MLFWMLEGQAEWPDKSKSLPYTGDPFHIYYDPFADALCSTSLYKGGN